MADIVQLSKKHQRSSTYEKKYVGHLLKPKQININRER